MEINSIFVIIAIFLLNINSGQCILPLIPVVVGGLASGLAGLGYMSMCRFKECCTDDYIPANFSLLDDLLKTKLYGQHLAHQTVLYALKGHFGKSEPKKPLVMSFHGLPGSGKNYVTNFIVDALYKKGDKSQYVHFYKGRLDFRSDGVIGEHQRKIQEDIENHLKLCPRSLFIFDEVEKIPNGTLNVLVPFLDYHSKIRGTDLGKAVFIFLSNSGGPSIAKELIQMWQAGKKREETKLQDFETHLAIAAFNEKGGFHKSETIETSLIDHYVPFLPLEEAHVRKCVIDAFERRSFDPSNEMIEKAMAYVTFGPSPHNLYSNAGCKRLDAKVSSIIEETRHQRP